MIRGAAQRRTGKTAAARRTPFYSLAAGTRFPRRDLSPPRDVPPPPPSAEASPGAVPGRRHPTLIALVGGGAGGESAARVRTCVRAYVIACVRFFARSLSRVLATPEEAARNFFPRRRKTIAAASRSWTDAPPNPPSPPPQPPYGVSAAPAQRRSRRNEARRSCPAAGRAAVESRDPEPSARPAASSGFSGARGGSEGLLHPGAHAAEC